jgi:hypothetical protein
MSPKSRIAFFCLVLTVTLVVGLVSLRSNGAAVTAGVADKSKPQDLSFSQCPYCHKNFDKFNNDKLLFKHEKYLQAHLNRGVVCQSCHTPFPHQPGQLIVKPSGAVCEKCHKPEAATRNAPARCDLCHPAAFIAASGAPQTGYYHTKPAVDMTPTVGLIDKRLPVTADKCAPCHRLGVEPRSRVRFKHSTHFERGIRCEACHDEYPHELDQPPKRPVMAKCSVCHSQKHGKQGMVAPKNCDFCHPPGFREKPASHTVYWMLQHKFEYKKGMNCFACHEIETCNGCHGYDEWPHPGDWIITHRKKARGMFRTVCLNCHYRNRSLCDSCHHKGYQKKEGPWISVVPEQSVHPRYYTEYGAKYCISSCHKPTFCPKCHIRGI